MLDGKIEFRYKSKIRIKMDEKEIRKKIDLIKQVALNEFLRRSMHGVTRFYHGKKTVIEWGGDMWTLFWEIWKIKKKKLKDLGFGVFKAPFNNFIIFCEIGKMQEWNEFKEKFKKWLDKC